MATDNINYETLLDHLPDGVYFVDRNRLITYWNSGAERITGHMREDMIGTVCTADFLGHLDEQQQPVFGGKAPVALTIEDGKTREHELFLRHRDGRLVPVLSRVSAIENSLGEAIGALEVFSDNSSRIQAQQRIEELEEIALICPLTGAGNRRHSEMALRDAAEELKRYGWGFGLLFVDIDHFKQINDTHGHDVGDGDLRMVVDVLKSGLRSFDFIGRWGGEEFIVILPNITDEILEMIAERCRRMVEEARYQHEGKAINVTVSVGGVLGQADDAPQDLVARADRLMYQSKEGGRNRVTVEG